MPLNVTTSELANPLPAMVRVTGLLPLIVTRSIDLPAFFGPPIIGERPSVA